MTNAKPLGDAAKSAVLLPFVITTLFWGSTWLVIRGQIGIVPPAWSVCYRFAIGAAAMFTVAWYSGTSLRTSWRDQAMIAIMSAFMFAINFNCVYRAEAHVTSGIVAVTFSLIVVFNALFGRIVFGQVPSRPFLVGSSIAFAGVAMLFAHEIRAVTANPHEAALGIGLALLGAISASIGNVMQSSARLKVMPMPAMLSWGMSWGAAVNAAIALTTTGLPLFQPTPVYVGGLIYLGIGASAVAFTLYFGMMRIIGPARTGYVNVITPVLAMLLSTVFESYSWTPLSAAGGVLVMLGLVVAMRSRKPAR